MAENIKRLTILLRNKVQLKNIQEEHEVRVRALDHFERSEKAYRRQEFESIKTNISPRRYEDSYYRIQGRICTGTGKWLMVDEVFMKWLDFSENSTRLLWFRGIPGAGSFIAYHSLQHQLSIFIGKTYLSCTVVSKTKTIGRTIYAFLSDALRNSTSALSIAHSLIFQLASDFEDLEAVVCQTVREDVKASLDKAFDLLFSLLACAGPVYIIIDGLDEIDEIERNRFMVQLLSLVKKCDTAKILLSSRAEDDLAKSLADVPTIRVDHRNTGSIQAYVSQNAQQWYRERNFSPEAQVEIDSLLTGLVANSKGRSIPSQPS